MISISTLVSPRLRDALIERADSLLDTMHSTLFRNPRRIVQFLRNIKYCYRPLLEKCDKILIHNVPIMDAEDVGIVLGLYQSLQFNSCDFRLAAKRRMMKHADACADPLSFSKFFAALAPIAGQEAREG